LFEFKEVHLFKACRHRYVQHINEGEHQKGEGDTQYHEIVRHFLHDGDNAEQEEHERTDPRCLCRQQGGDAQQDSDNGLDPFAHQDFSSVLERVVILLYFLLFFKRFHD
jgi:hypothetical protein